MLEFKDAAGYVWYFNHLISFIVLSVSFIWACKQSLTGKKDKFLHYIISAGLTLLLIMLFNFVHFHWWISPIFVALVGIGKEIYDKLHPKKHTCDIKDLIADFIGIASVSIFYLCSFVLYKEI